MRKYIIVTFLGLAIGIVFPNYVVAEFAQLTPERQQELKEAPGFDIRTKMIKRGEITFPKLLRVGLKAVKVPETSLKAASSLAALPGKEYVKSFYINWGPRNLPRDILNFDRPLTEPDTRSPIGACPRMRILIF